MAWFLAEVEGFEHPNIHLMSREDYMPSEPGGKRVFDWLLDAPDEGATTDEETDRIAPDPRPCVAREKSSWFTNRPTETGSATYNWRKG